MYKNDLQSPPASSRVKKMSLWEGLPKSRAYNPDPKLTVRRLARLKSLVKSVSENLSKSKTLDETFRARQACPQSLGSDYTIYMALRKTLSETRFFTRALKNCSNWCEFYYF